jgi:hypothetical protein
MAESEDAVRALKRLERAARDAARALAQERQRMREWLRQELAGLGIGLKNAEPKEGQSDGGSS